MKILQLMLHQKLYLGFNWVVMTLNVIHNIYVLSFKGFIHSTTSNGSKLIQHGVCFGRDMPDIAFQLPSER